MALLELFDMRGKSIEKAELPDEIFDAPVRSYLHSEIVNWQRARKRSGAQSALTKAEVSGSTKKPFPQKGRGVARQGSATKNPHQKGGGVAFAPKPRDFGFSMPKSKKRAALVSAISTRVKEGRVRIIDKLELEAGKTKEINKILQDFSLSGCLLVDEQNKKARLASRNHPDVKFIEAQGLNTMDILRFPSLIMTRNAAKTLGEKLIGVAE